MNKNDPRVDAYIAKSADFAKPILNHLRATVHKACPEATESIKWGMPFFVRNGLLCNMAAFKAHVAFGFWNGSRVTGEQGDGAGMGQLGRLTSLKDLPPDKTLVAWVKKAVILDEAGVKSPTRAKALGPKKNLPVPADLKAALAKSKKATAAFAKFTDAQRRE
ncbi:MAG TPA: DUF1801 domain-containing protein, partial [Fibrobacteria bacterium]|nr:DUF1801 domain-containing protein [Fibrobacteria bacterium]